jgi:hypothetical protein
MRSAMTPQGKLRNVYIHDPKKINEQECYRQGLQHLREGDADYFRVHWHAYNDGCPFATYARERQPSPACYEIRKEDLT